MRQSEMMNLHAAMEEEAAADTQIDNIRVDRDYVPREPQIKRRTTVAAVNVAKMSGENNPSRLKGNVVQAMHVPINTEPAVLAAALKVTKRDESRAAGANLSGVPKPSSQLPPSMQGTPATRQLKMAYRKNTFGATSVSQCMVRNEPRLHNMSHSCVYSHNFNPAPFNMRVHLLYHPQITQFEAREFKEYHIRAVHGDPPLPDTQEPCYNEHGHYMTKIQDHFKRTVDNTLTIEVRPLDHPKRKDTMQGTIDTLLNTTRASIENHHAAVIAMLDALRESNQVVSAHRL